MTRILTAAAVALSGAACVAPARAATPDSGSIGVNNPSVRWTGQAAGYGFNSASSGGFSACAQPFCDTFTLEVRNVLDLVVTVTANGAPGFTAVQLTRPDGMKVFSRGEEGVPSTTLKVISAPVGVWVIEQATDSPLTGDSSYAGEARLERPASALPAGPEGRPPPPGSPSRTATTIELRTRSVPARTARRRLKLRVRSDGPVTRVGARLMKGSKVVGSGKLAGVDGDAVITVRLKRALKRGKYWLALSGSGQGGARVSSLTPLRVR